jgi:hypothetical protein
MMMQFMRAGGYSMWVVLLFGGIALTTAVIFAFKPEEGRLGFIRGMTMATIFATISGVAADVGATFHASASYEDWARYPDIAGHILIGLSESTTPAILGFTLLGIVWFVVAIGLRRLSNTP